MTKIPAPHGPFRDYLRNTARKDVAGKAGARNGAPVVPSKLRRTQTIRIQEARDRLMRAAVDVLVERGYNGLTTKDVAARAGFSSGALGHHFKTKADLVVAATMFAYEQAVEPSRKIAATIDTSTHPLRDFIEDSWQVYFDWTFTIALEVLVIARTDPALMTRIEPVMRSTRETMIEIWTQAFARAGMAKADSEALIALTLLIVRGMAMDDVWIKDKQRLKALLSLWAEIATAQIATRRPVKPPARQKAALSQAKSQPKPRTKPRTK